MARNVTEFIAETTAYQNRQDTALEGLTGDVVAQAALIKQLQENPGVFSPADQAAVDALQARNEAITAKLEALDAQTAPTPPVVPPTA